MREREEIEREIEQRRDDLAENIVQLKEAVRDKVQEVKDAVNLPKRAREAVAAGKEHAVDAAREIRDAARERPLLFAGIAAGVLLTAGLAVRRMRRVRRERRLRHPAA
jgi:hypothetical protein